jgi:D-3-phosphoglycerate dehydrogenase
MNIALLDDYQDSERHLDCFRMLDGHEVKGFPSSARGLGQLAVRLTDFDVLVLNRDHTPISRQLTEQLPRLKRIVQMGTVGPNIDTAAAHTRGVAVREWPTIPSHRQS